MQRQFKEKDGRLDSKIVRELGPHIMSALFDPEITEIMVNSDGKIWFERREVKTNEYDDDDDDDESEEYVAECDNTEENEVNDEEQQDGKKYGMYDSGHTIKAQYLLTALGSIASDNGKEINEKNPILSAVLKISGSRVLGIVPPASPNGPSITIRKHSSAVIPLRQYIKQGRVPKAQADFLRECIKTKKNIIVAGGTKSGKTTFVNALIKETVKLTPKDRIIIMEDTYEIQCGAENKERLVTLDGVITMQELVKASLRMRPDRIIVGEVRGKESLDLLKALNTGHPGGFATLHCNDAVSSLTRLESLNMEAEGQNPQCKLIGDAVDVVAYMEKTDKTGAQLAQVIRVNNYKGGEYNYETLYNIKE